MSSGLPLYETMTLLGGEGYPIRFGWLNAGLGSSSAEGGVNIALWLYRFGLSHPTLPAAAIGKRVVASYGQLAGRVGAARRRLAQPVEA